MKFKPISFIFGALFALVTSLAIGQSTQNGQPILTWSDIMRAWPQVIDLNPTEPYPCTDTDRGRIAYVDNNGDFKEAFLCQCGVDADDATPAWVKVNDPTADCFVVFM